VRIPGRLHRHALNISAIGSLCERYDFFMISNVTDVANAFYDAMRAFQATWLWTNLPVP
jgi:hypothetical protein